MRWKQRTGVSAGWQESWLDFSVFLDTGLFRRWLWGLRRATDVGMDCYEKMG